MKIFFPLLLISVAHANQSIIPIKIATPKIFIKNNTTEIEKEILPFLNLKDIPKFYKLSEEYIKVNKDITKDSLKIIYYITQAPLIQQTKENSYYFPDDIDVDQDFILKTTICFYIAYSDINEISKKTGINENEIKNLNSSCFARTLFFINNYPSVPFTQKEIDNLRWGKHTLSMNSKDISQLNTNLNALASRRIIADSTKYALETPFIEMLIQYYPDDATKVKKYIEAAGYKKEDIIDLINKTVGRKPKTEFLYKKK